MHKLASKITRSAAQLRITQVSLELLHILPSTTPSTMLDLLNDHNQNFTFWNVYTKLLPNKELASSEVLLFMALATAVQANDEL